jgi:phenylacetate-CoA ligase
MQYGVDNRASSTIHPDRFVVIARKLALTERLTAEELYAYQAPLIAQLLAHAHGSTDFYRARLDFDLSSSESIDEAWAQIPISTRAEAIENNEHLRSRRTAPETGPVIESETSGSTGMPLRFKRTAQLHITSIALTDRMFRWWGVDGKKSFAQVFYDAKRTPRSVTREGGILRDRMACTIFYRNTTDIDRLVDWLRTHRPNYFGAYSSILKGLAITAHGRNLELEFDLLFLFATVVDEDLRVQCRSMFGGDIADTYGSQEVSLAMMAP